VSNKRNAVEDKINAVKGKKACFWNERFRLKRGNLLKKRDLG
jgi:hypothetical protein